MTSEATTTKPEPPVDMLLEMEVSAELSDYFTMHDPTFRVGGRRFRMAYLEEVPTALADEDDLVVIDPESGDLFQVEFEVFVRKLQRVEDSAGVDVPVVDPNQLAIDVPGVSS